MRIKIQGRHILPDPLLTLKELGEIEEQLHAMIIEEFDGNKSQKSEKDQSVETK